VLESVRIGSPQAVSKSSQ